MWLHYCKFHFLVQKADFANAAPHALRCGNLAALIGERVYEIQVLSGLGACYANLGDFEQAIPCFSSALDLAQAGGFVLQQYSALYKIGACMVQMGQLEGGIEFLTEVRNAGAVSARSRIGALARAH